MSVLIPGQLLTAKTYTPLKRNHQSALSAPSTCRSIDQRIANWEPQSLRSLQLYFLLMLSVFFWALRIRIINIYLIDRKIVIEKFQTLHSLQLYLLQMVFFCSLRMNYQLDRIENFTMHHSLQIHFLHPTAYARCLSFLQNILAFLCNT